MSMPATKQNDVHQFDPSVVRAYDVRGVVDETLSTTDAYYFGKCVVFNKQRMQPPDDHASVDGECSRVPRLNRFAHRKEYVFFNCIYRVQ